MSDRASWAGMWGQVVPYWAFSYAPDPFQPALSVEAIAAGSMGRCPGFDDDPEHYACWPNPHDYSNCWKCPPKVGQPWSLAVRHVA